jgi:hypothetical protein
VSKFVKKAKNCCFVEKNNLINQKLKEIKNIYKILGFKMVSNILG